MTEVANDLQRIRHSLAHVMADAVTELFPEAKVAIGPAIEERLLLRLRAAHAVQRPRTWPEIEARMRRDHRQATGLRAPGGDEARGPGALRRPAVQAGADRRSPGGRGHLHLPHGDFTDLCRGPHVAARARSTTPSSYLSVAGAYWRGDEHRPMLQRIYGTALDSPGQL